MPKICSTVKRIDALKLKQLPLQRKISGDVVRAGEVVVVRDLDGVVYTLNLPQSSSYLDSSRVINDVLQALVKLTVVKPTDAEAHLAACYAVDALETARSDALQLVGILEDHQLSTLQEINSFVQKAMGA